MYLVCVDRRRRADGPNKRKVENGYATVLDRVDNSGPTMFLAAIVATLSPPLN